MLGSEHAEIPMRAQAGRAVADAALAALARGAIAREEADELERAWRTLGLGEARDLPLGPDPVSPPQGRERGRLWVVLVIVAIVLLYLLFGGLPVFRP